MFRYWLWGTLHFMDRTIRPSVLIGISTMENCNRGHWQLPLFRRKVIDASIRITDKEPGTFGPYNHWME